MAKERTVRASVYTNKSEKKGISVSVPYEMGEALVSGDKGMAKAILDPIREAVKADREKS